VVIAKNLVSKYFKEEGEGLESFAEGDKLIPWKIIATCKGAELNGLRYEQLMPFEANDPKTFEGDPFKIVLGDFVTTEDGTGIVHTSPAFGADDYKVGQ
jgi:isoleucyl-tRNA synthetase